MRHDARPLALAVALALAAGCSRPETKPEDRPFIQLSTAQVSFTMEAYDAGSFSPALAEVQISNGGGEPDPSAQPTGLIGFVGPSDWMSGAFAVTAEGYTLRLERDAVGLLDPGVYTATVWITWQGASNSPVGVDVTLTVNPHEHTFQLGPAMVRPSRVFHTTTLLPDGSALVIGGRSGESIMAPNESLIERRDPITGEWSSAGNLWRARQQHTATLLEDGTVLIAGGARVDSAIDPPGMTWEIYDPLTETVVAHGSLAARRDSHGAVRLEDGEVLLVGGWGAGTPERSCELFDPVTRTSRLVGSLHGDASDAPAVLLRDGRVLVTPIAADGWEIGTEIYDPADEGWTVVASRRYPRREHATVLLADGKVLVAGGYGWNTDEGPVQAVYPPAAEVFDPETGAWSDAGALHRQHVSNHYGAALLPDGRVMLAGGGREEGTLEATSMVEVLDPDTWEWSIDGALTYARREQTVTVLPDGTVLVVGGWPEVPNRAETWKAP